MAQQWRTGENDIQKSYKRTLRDLADSGEVPKARRAYAIFTGDKSKALEGNLKAVSAAWHKLTFDERDEYNAKAAKELQLQQGAMAARGKEPRTAYNTQLPQHAAKVSTPLLAPVTSQVLLHAAACPREPVKQQALPNAAACPRTDDLVGATVATPCPSDASSGGMARRVAATPNMPFFVCATGGISTTLALGSSRAEREPEVGEGSYGSVIRAFSDDHGDRVYAAKLMKEKDEASRDLYFYNLLEEHVNKVGAHPSFLNVVSHHVGDPYSWISMLVVRDCSLRRQLANRREPFQDRQVTFLCKHMRGAIRFLHSAGVVHMDIKSAIVLLDESTFHVYIVDYSLSYQFPSKKTAVKFRYCTSWYRPHKMWMRLPLPPSAIRHVVDCWSSGCVFYEVSGGGVLFAGEIEEKARYIVFQLIDNYCNEITKSSLLKNIKAPFRDANLKLLDNNCDSRESFISIRFL